MIFLAAKTAIKEPKRSSALVRRETFASYCFLLPSLIFFLGFVIYPMILCVVTSFFDSTMNRADVFVGLANYKELFTDPIFLGALKNTFIIVIVSVPVTCVFSLWVSSAIVDLPEWATSLFRCVFYLPVVTGSVAVTVVWKWMYNNYYGIFNYLGKSLGILDKNINWLGDERFALGCIILILLTTSVGQPIVLYVSALGNVDQSIVEAAEVDGATDFQCFWKIKWPAIMPTTLYILVITTINSFQCFALIQLLTSGGPNHSTDTIMYYIYYTAFKLYRYGYGNAMGVVLAVIIAIAVSSNLQGAATLVGDTTSILLGGYAGMDFMDFFWMNGKPSIFFAVELGALLTVPVIMFLFRNQREPVEIDEHTDVTDYVPTILLGATVVLLIAASFLPHKPAMMNGIICMGLFIIGAVYSIVRNKNTDLFRQALSEIDYETLMLLAGLFVVIGGITEAGIIDEISKLFVRVGGANPFVLFTILVWGSVLISAFVDNIPYVATMLPVVTSIAAATGANATLLYFGLLTGATLGGNLTPIGASANIAAIGILRKNGYEVKSSDFFKIGIPFTIVAVTTGYLFTWFVWG